MENEYQLSANDNDEKILIPLLLYLWRWSIKTKKKKIAYRNRWKEKIKISSEKINIIAPSVLILRSCHWAPVVLYRTWCNIRHNSSRWRDFVSSSYRLEGKQKRRINSFSVKKSAEWVQEFKSCTFNTYYRKQKPHSLSVW